MQMKFSDGQSVFNFAIISCSRNSRKLDAHEKLVFYNITFCILLVSIIIIYSYKWLMSNDIFLGFTLRRTMSLSTYKFETLNVTEPSEFVYHVEINRPEKRNAMNMTFWRFKCWVSLLVYCWKFQHVCHNMLIRFVFLEMDLWIISSWNLWICYVNVEVLPALVKYQYWALVIIFWLKFLIPLHHAETNIAKYDKRRAVAAQTARSRVNLYTHCLGTIDIPGQVVSRSQ